MANTVEAAEAGEAARGAAATGATAAEANAVEAVAAEAVASLSVSKRKSSTICYCSYLLLPTAQYSSSYPTCSISS